MRRTAVRQMRCNEQEIHPKRDLRPSDRASIPYTIRSATPQAQSTISRDYLSNHDSICRRLDWDSEFFAGNIARLTMERLTEDTAAQVRAWCECNRIDC